MREGTAWGVAAPRNDPFGTIIDVPGCSVGTVQDRGGAIQGSNIDVWFPTTRGALRATKKPDDHGVRMKIGVAVCLLVALVGCHVGIAQELASGRNIVAYSRGDSHTSSSLALESPRGTVHRLSLVPDVDTRRHVVVLDLRLQRAGAVPDDVNLFEPTGKLHGYQPHFFAASDFADGPRKSLYGARRVIPLRDLGMTVEIRIVDVHVERISDPVAGSAFEFDSLKLEINTH